MYREEWFRDEAILKYGLRGRDAEMSKSSSLFAESIVPNLLIPSCIYNIDTVSRATFSKLVLLLTKQQHALPLLFVHLPPGYRDQNQPLPVRLSRECQCTCYCKCHGCRKDCICKCPAGCVHCAEEVSCKCKLEPIIVALTGQGKGEGEILLLRWCDELPEERDGHDSLCGNNVKARVEALLSAHKGGPAADPGTQGQLVPLLHYWKAASALAIQAAYCMHLHKGVLEDVGLERQRLARGKCNNQALLAGSYKVQVLQVICAAGMCEKVLVMSTLLQSRVSKHPVILIASDSNNCSSTKELDF